VRLGLPAFPLDTLGLAASIVLGFLGIAEALLLGALEALLLFPYLLGGAGLLGAATLLAVGFLLLVWRQKLAVHLLLEVVDLVGHGFEEAVRRGDQRPVWFIGL